MAADTKQRMVEAAADSFQRHGVSATSFSDVLNASGAARGAIYHHFPDGKTQLARDAVAWTGQRVAANLSFLPGDTPAEVFNAFLEKIRPIVAQATLGRSCAVAAVVIEMGQSDSSLTHAASEALQSWVAALEKRLLDCGMTPGTARSTSVLMVAFLEGIQVLCRARGDMTSFDEGANALRRLQLQ